MASSLEFNKVAAAVLTAGVIVVASGVISRILYRPEIPDEPAYRIDIAAGEASGGDEAAAGETITLAALLAAGDPAGGQSVAKKCASCHSFDDGGPNKIGPALYGVLDRDIASVAGFGYSDALAGLDGSWDYEALGAFLSDPKGYAPGTKMAFAGVKKPGALGDLILYLRSLGDGDTPLPAAEGDDAAAADAEAKEDVAATDGEGQAGAAEGEATEEVAATAGDGEAAAADAEGATQVAAVESGEAEGAGDEQSDLGARLAAADLDAGAKGARKCATCHTFEEGGRNKLGPVLWNVLDRDIASVEGFKYSAALTDAGGEWDYQALDGYLSDPKAWVPGTKMAFAGIRKPEDRADVILYLRSLADQPAPLP